MKKTWTIFTKIWNQTRIPTFTIAIHIVTEFLSRDIRPKKKERTKEIQTEKEEIKLSLFAGDTSLYIRKSRFH